MSAQIGPYVPLLIVAMVTWKVANSPSASSASATSTSTYPYRTSSSSSRSKNSYVNAWGSSISERVSARNVRHSRTGSSPRSSAAGTNGHVRRGPQSMSPGSGGIRMGGAGGRITGGVSYGARGPAEGGRR